MLWAKVHSSEEQPLTPIPWSHKTCILMQSPACLTCQIWRATSRTIINSNLITSSSAVDLWTTKVSIMTIWLDRTKCLVVKTSSSTIETLIIISRKTIIPWRPFNLPLKKINNRIIIQEPPPHKKWQWKRKSRHSSKCSALSRQKPMPISTLFSWTVRCWKKRQIFSGK